MGPPLVYTTLSEVSLQRPDKLRVINRATAPPPSSTRGSARPLEPAGSTIVWFPLPERHDFFDRATPRVLNQFPRKVTVPVAMS